MDSAKLMIETLRQIDYPQVDKLDPNALEWAFENPSTKQFLDWFCNNLSVDNLVSGSDLQIFTDLESKGSVLTGDQLRDNLPPLEDLHLDEQHLRSDIKSLETSLKDLKIRKELLLRRNTNWTTCHMEKKNKLMKLHHVEERWSKILKHNIEKTGAVNVNIDESVKHLSQSVQTLASLYQPLISGGQPTGRSHGNNVDFLSQAELKAFHEAEERFSKDLTAFTKKQFFSGMAEVPGEQEGSTYSLLDISHSDSLDGSEFSRGWRGEDQAFLKDCQEFNRIKDIFPSAETSCINALIDMKKASSAVTQAQAILSQLQGGTFPGTDTQLRLSEHTVKETLLAAHSDATPFLEAVPDLIKELGALQGTNILTGDYDLKLKRQNYFVHNQDRVIKHLVSQRARNELLSLMYEIEIRWHKDTHRLVMAAKQRLEEHLTAWKNRVKELSGVEYTVSQGESGVVDVRDRGTERLHLMMEEFGSGDPPLVLHTTHVTSQAAALTSSVEGATLGEEEGRGREEATVEQLSTVSQDCQDVLYSGSSTTTGLPTLTAPNLQRAMSELNSDLSQLETHILRSVEDVDHKMTQLRNNSLQRKERQLYIYFHNNPTQLQSMVARIQERSQAQAMSES